MSATVIEALRSGLASEMATDPRVVALGEDIGIGGSFHLTLGLIERLSDPGGEVRDGGQRGAHACACC